MTDNQKARLEAFNKLVKILKTGKKISLQVGPLGALDSQVHELLVILHNQSLVEFADLIQATYDTGLVEGSIILAN